MMDETHTANMHHMGGSVWYLSTVRGINKRAREKPQMTYLGTTYRVPKEIYGTDQQLEHEQTLADILQIVTGNDGAIWTPVLGEPIERYECRDLETGDVLVMYRVAYEVQETPLDAA